MPILSGDAPDHTSVCLPRVRAAGDKHKTSVFSHVRAEYGGFSLHRNQGGSARGSG